MQSEDNIIQIRHSNIKREIVKYAILAALFSILVVKAYLMIFVINIVIGIYSFTTTFVLFSILIISYKFYRDPYYEAKKKLAHYRGEMPLVSIVVPVKNEEDNIHQCIQSCLDSTYSNKEVIVVNDASTDRTPAILDNMHKEYPELKVLHLPKNVGKKKAIEAGTELARGEIFVFMDSDCIMANDAVENAVTIFMSDYRIGAVTAHGRVRDADKGSALLKLQDTWFDTQFRVLKGMESTFSSLTCCSGSFSSFRRIAVQPYIHKWAHDRFLGMEFKFATDRRLTAYVLGTKPPANGMLSKDANNKDHDTSDGSSILSVTTDDDVHSMKQSADPYMSDYNQKYLWKLKYSPHIRVYVSPPKTFGALIKQQIRWRKSFIRSITATGGVYWRRPFFAAMLYYLQLSLKFVRPYVLINALFVLPLVYHDYYSTLFYATSVFFVGMIYGFDFKINNPGNNYWLYRPVMSLVSMFVYSWLIFYAAITIKKTTWR